MTRVIIYNGYVVKALRRDLMPRATIIEIGEPSSPATPRPVSQTPPNAVSEPSERATGQLMLLPAHVLAKAARAGKRRGHAGAPGGGPAGETCGSCRHVLTSRSRSGKTFVKCGLMRAHWTHGGGSDVRRKDAACLHWKEK